MKPKPVIPQRAFDILQSGGDSSDIVEEEVLTTQGTPASGRSARRYALYYKQFLLGDIDLEVVDTEGEDELDYSDEIIFKETDKGAIAGLQSDQLMTLEEVLERCQVDTTLWEVEKFEIKTYDGWRADKQKDLQFVEGKSTGYVKDIGGINTKTLYSLKVTLKRRELAAFDLAVDELVQRVEAKAPTYGFPEPLYTSGQHLLVLGLVDSHFNKRSTDGSYTLEEAKRRFVSAGVAMLRKAVGMNYQVEKIIIPIGNDVFNTDNLQSQTTKGTYVESVGDARDAVDVVIAAHVELINRAAELAPVEVLVVPGNHDFFQSYMLGKVVDAYYRNHPYVTVDSRKQSRKYVVYGNNLLGFDHGQKLKPAQIALIMATEAEDWSNKGKQYREFLTGHLHKEREMFHSVSTEQSVVVRTLPALCDTDEWHYSYGFIGSPKASIALMYHSERGLDTTIVVHKEELDD